MFENDPKFQKLKAELEKATIAYKNAIQHRKRVRKMFEEKRTKPKPVRRPVGSPKDYRIPEETPSTQVSQQKPMDFKIYMGPILGWQKLRAAPTISPSPPEEPFQVDKTFDQVSLKLYWNAKTHFQRCKDEFDKYIKQVLDRKRIPARNAVTHQANMQILGISEVADFTEARSAVEKNCKEALVYYKSFPQDKPREAIIPLLENMADAQFVDLESDTTSQMHSEMQILHNAGKLENE